MGKLSRPRGPEEKGLYKFMRKDRVAEVHHSGSNRSVGQESVEFPGGRNRTNEGLFETNGGPLGTERSVAYRKTYHFNIDGVDRKVTEACKAYFALLKRMVAEFEAAPPPIDFP
jgi:hypothetical protein